MDILIRNTHIINKIKTKQKFILTREFEISLSFFFFLINYIFITFLIINGDIFLLYKFLFIRVFL